MAATDEGGQDIAITVDDPFNNFRRHPIHANINEPNDLLLLELDSGVYLQVPSKHASCLNMVSVYSKYDVNSQQDSRADTRFGVTTRPVIARPRQWQQRQRGANIQIGQLRTKSHADANEDNEDNERAGFSQS